MLLSLILAAKIATSEPPKAFPNFDLETAQPLVIKAKFTAGEYLPQFQKCSESSRDGKLGVICLDPPPFWITASDLSEVYGNLTGNSVPFATTSHYGLEQMLNAWKGKPHLLLLLRHGDDYVMPRYAEAIVLTARSGEDYVPLNKSGPIWWLPCSAANLKEPLDRQNFPHADWQGFYSQGAFPKYGIPLKKLAMLLASVRPNAKQMTCGREI